MRRRTFMTLWVLGGTAVASTANAADYHLTPASLRRLAAGAQSAYGRTVRATGTAGVQQALRRCYSLAPRTHDERLAVSCVMEDLYATRIQISLFPNMPEDFFTEQGFAIRAASVVDQIVPGERVNGLIADMTAAEDAVEQQRFMKARAGGNVVYRSAVAR